MGDTLQVGNNSATKAGVLTVGYKDPEELQRVYRACGSLANTAEAFGVSKKLILTHLKRFGITRNPPRQKKLIDVTVATYLLDIGYRVEQVAQMLGVSQPTLLWQLREHNIPTDRFHKGYLRNERGYVRLRRPDHPGANPQGYVMEHRLVMEAAIGRYLTDDEVVHHINELKHDNRLENLQLMTKREHKSYHASKYRKNKI